MFSLQVLLRWGLESGCAVIPKSVRPERIQQYSENRLLGWEFPEDAMELLNAMPQEPKVCWDPSTIA